MHTQDCFENRGILVLALLKSCGFIAAYFLFGLFAALVCSGSDSVHITFVADSLLVVFGLLYCSRYVFPHDRVRRENSGGLNRRRLILGLIETFAIWLLLQMTVSVFQTYFTDANYARYSDNLIHANLAEMLFLTIFLAPAAEEILMRGMVQTCLRARYGPVAAILLSSVVFAVLHGTVTHLYFAFVLGVVFGVLYEKTSSLLVPVAAHVLCNFMSFGLANISFLNTWPFYVVLAVLNLWMWARLIYVLHVMYFDYKTSKLMSESDFDDSCSNHVTV